MLILTLVAAIYVFFALYVLTMALYRVHIRGAMPRAGYILGWPWVALAFVVDFLFQYTVFALLYRECPPSGEHTVTRRLSRWKSYPEDTLRRRWSVKLCRFLSLFSDGPHC
jgi:hypothetical protein